MHSRPCRPHSHMAGGGAGEAQMGAKRAVVGVCRLDSPDPCRFMRFLVEVDACGAAVTGDSVAEFSAVVVCPRLLIDKCPALQADELALVVFYTTGVPKKRAGEGQRTAHGTRWGELLGCGNTALGIRDQIVKSHSPCLLVTDSVWFKICAAVQQSRGADSSMRPRLEGGMQWCPKDLGCVVQNLYHGAEPQRRALAAGHKFQRSHGQCSWSAATA